MKKKLLCLVLSLAMMAVFMPTMAFADSTEVNVSSYSELNAAIELQSSGVTQSSAAVEEMVSNIQSVREHADTVSRMKLIQR